MTMTPDDNTRKRVPPQCDCCGRDFGDRVFTFKEKNFPERSACSRSCYDIVVARAIGSAIFIAPPAMNLRQKLSKHAARSFPRGRRNSMIGIEDARACRQRDQ
jgi:hypothetical protein